MGGTTSLGGTMVRLCKLADDMNEKMADNNKPVLSDRLLSLLDDEDDSSNLPSNVLTLLQSRRRYERSIVQWGINNTWADVNPFEGYELGADGYSYKSRPFKDIVNATYNVLGVDSSTPHPCKPLDVATTVKANNIIQEFADWMDITAYNSPHAGQQSQDTSVLELSRKLYGLLCPPKGGISHLPTVIEGEWDNKITATWKEERVAYDEACHEAVALVARHILQSHPKVIAQTHMSRMLTLTVNKQVTKCVPIMFNDSGCLTSQESFDIAPGRKYYCPISFGLWSSFSDSADTILPLKIDLNGSCPRPLLTPYPAPTNTTNVTKLRGRPFEAWGDHVSHRILQETFQGFPLLYVSDTTFIHPVPYRTSERLDAYPAISSYWSSVGTYAPRIVNQAWYLKDSIEPGMSTESPRLGVGYKKKRQD